MSEILLVNPRRRKRRKMSAKQRKYFGGARRNPRRRKRASSRRRKRNPGFALPATFGNPRRRKRRSRSSVRRRRARGYRRNPAPRLSVRGVQGQLMGAVPGAFGALALDVAMGYLPVPANWKGGIIGYVVKAAAAIGIGMVASKVVRGATAAKMTEGALTVMLHGILRTTAAQYAPQIQLGAYDTGNDGAGWNPSVGLNAYLPDIGAGNSGGEYLDNGMGAYIGDSPDYDGL